MELLKIAWHYAITIWPYAIMLCGTFAGILFGIKIGCKWGKEDAERWLKTKIAAANHNKPWTSITFPFFTRLGWQRPGQSAGYIRNRTRQSQ